MTLFSSLGLKQELLDAIQDIGFTEATPIQSETIPQLIEVNGERDLIALAQTGTGKTAAFGLPLLHILSDLPAAEPKCPTALILSPTRELCMQITGEMEKYGARSKHLRLLAVYGGSSVRDQQRTMRRGVDVLVATPGRLMDLARRGDVKFDSLKTLVLDEADEMLNMGFLDDVREVLEKSPDTMNTWLFSATMPKQVEKITRDFMKDSIHVQIGTRNEGSSQVEHKAFLTTRENRYQGIRRLIDSSPGMYAMIFCTTKRETQEVAENLIGDGYTAAAIHGDLSQQQRDLVMHAFRSKQVRMLVCTDVAARGIDVKDITHVIHHRLPNDLEGYTHRSGRTGRAGKTGLSWALVTNAEARKIPQLEKAIKRDIPREKFPSRNDVVIGQLLHFAEKVSSQSEGVELVEKNVDALLPMFEGMETRELVTRFLATEFDVLFRHYAEHVDLDLNKNERGNRGERRESNNRRDRDSMDSGRGFREKKDEQRVWINLGTKQGLTWPLLKDFVRETAKLGDFEVQGVNVGPAHGYFTVPTSKIESVRGLIEGGEWDGTKIKLDLVEHHVGREERKRDEGGSRMRGRGGRPGGNQSWGGGRSAGGRSGGGSRSGGGRFNSDSRESSRPSGGPRRPRL